MFETAVVRPQTADRRFSWLSISLVVHSAAIAAVLTASIATVRLPEQAPKQMTAFLPAIAPPPVLGTPNPTPAQPRPRTTNAAAPRAAVAPIAVTAPTVISNTITPAADYAQNPGPPATIGSPIGSDIGVGAESPSTAIAPDAAGPLPIGNGVKSPVVIQRVEPIYPPLAIRAHMSGSVVLECIIDKSGRIRDVRVANSSFGAFEQPAIDAVRQWVFAPGTLNGQAVDTIFELTVKFQVK
ncbi:MAG: TonB family protein [Acidobacteriota bacterium]|nr:TonB family protein [Acidobacteriota bacterium]